MLYLLTEDEYRSIKTHARDERDALRDVLQDLCTKVADHMPVEHKMPFGCVLTQTTAYGHCGGCPVEQICPNEHKAYGK